MRPTVYYTDHYEIPLPEGHRFPIAKYRMLRSRLEDSGKLDLRPAPLADVSDILRAHSEQYVREFLTGTLPPAAMRRIGFPWSEGLVLRTLASVGSTLAASNIALRHGWSGGLAGGTHHAFRSEGSGYCIFNDVAIAILTLRMTERIERAAVIDCDVHQGDGTAKIFEGDPGVLTISLHGKNNFPFRKQRSDIDVEIPDGAGDRDYLTSLEKVLAHVEPHRPDIVFFQSGVDTLHSDRLGKLNLTHEGLRLRDERVLALPYPLVIVLGGGYGEPITDTVDAHASTFLNAARLRTFAT